MKKRRSSALTFLAVGAFAVLALGCASAGGTAGGDGADGGRGGVADGGGSSDGGSARDGGGTGTTGSACVNVGDCAHGYGCLSGHCVNAGTYECRNDLAPIVQVEPATLDFGSVRVADRVDRTLRIRNIGSCVE